MLNLWFYLVISWYHSDHDPHCDMDISTEREKQLNESRFKLELSTCTAAFAAYDKDKSIWMILSMMKDVLKNKKEGKTEVLWRHHNKKIWNGKKQQKEYVRYNEGNAL